MVAVFVAILIYGCLPFDWGCFNIFLERVEESESLARPPLDRLP